MIEALVMRKRIAFGRNWGFSLGIGGLIHRAAPPAQAQFRHLPSPRPQQTQQTTGKFAGAWPAAERRPLRPQPRPARILAAAPRPGEGVAGKGWALWGGGGPLCAKLLLDPPSY